MLHAVVTSAGEVSETVRARLLAMEQVFLAEEATAPVVPEPRLHVVESPAKPRARTAEPGAVARRRVRPAPKGGG